MLSHLYRKYSLIQSAIEVLNRSVKCTDEGWIKEIYKTRNGKKKCNENRG